jgi:hypothetical protein
MHTVRLIRNTKNHLTRYCAVDLAESSIIPFTSPEWATRTTAELNNGTENPKGYATWDVVDCYFANDGSPLRPKTLDGPVLAPVNVMGLDYSVPKPVADYLAHLKNTVFNLALKIDELQEQRKGIHATGRYFVNGESVSEAAYRATIEKFYNEKNA